MAEITQSTFIAAPPKDLVLEKGFRFLHGQVIAPFTIRYESFGELNADKSNAILVCHALSASAHAAGKFTSADEERPGWWDGLVGYGKGIDIAEIEDGGPELFVYPASDRGSVLPSAAVIRQSSRSRIYSIAPPLKFTRVIPTPR